MANDRPGLLGRKVGMTQIFADNGDVIPCTIIETGANSVLQLKSAEGADGYSAVQLGFDVQKASRVTKAQMGHFQKAGVEPQRFVREIRLTEADLASYPAGGTVGAGDIFELEEKVDVVGVSKGRGFAGVMKRYHFAGFERHFLWQRPSDLSARRQRAGVAHRTNSAPGRHRVDRRRTVLCGWVWGHRWRRQRGGHPTASR